MCIKWPNDHSDVHRHVWAQSGCYCGAHRCQWFGYTNGEELAIGAGLLHHGGELAFCSEPSERGQYCPFHNVAMQYLSCNGSVALSVIRAALASLNDPEAHR